MDELTRALQIRNLAKAVVDDPGNPARAKANCLAIMELAEHIDEGDHVRVRKMLSLRSISEMTAPATETTEAPEPENKAVEPKKPAKK